MAGTDVVFDKKTKLNVSEPTLWKVVFLNDDVTPIDFVISLLIEVFKHNFESARTVTIQVHEQGSGIAGVYNYEIAEAKTSEATNLSRANGFPLQIKMVEE